MIFIIFYSTQYNKLQKAHVQNCVPFHSDFIVYVLFVTILLYLNDRSYGSTQNESLEYK